MIVGVGGGGGDRKESQIVRYTIIFGWLVLGSQK